MEDLSLGLKEPGHEAERFPPSSAEVKDKMNCTLTIPYTVHRDTFTFTFYRDGSHILK